MRAFTPVTDGVLVEELYRAPEALLYKHSAACWLGRRALREVRRFAEAHPQVPIYQVDVLGERGISQRIADELGIRHESPQVIVLAWGRPAWHASHMAVTAQAIAQRIGALDGHGRGGGA